MRKYGLLCKIDDCIQVVNRVSQGQKYGCVPIVTTYLYCENDKMQQHKDLVQYHKVLM